MILTIISIIVANIFCINSEIVVQFKIIGGKETIIDNHPYIVSITYHDKHICGGVIIKEDTILTTAHCFPPNTLNPIVRWQYYKINAGKTKIDDQTGHIMNISEVICHPKFNMTSMTHDIAVIKMKKSLRKSSTIDTILLPPSYVKAIPVGRMAEVSGWGVRILREDASPSNILRTVNVTILSNDHCRQVYGQRYSGEMFCAGDVKEGKRDACVGDSGGPLIYRNGTQKFLLGLVSWGKTCANKNYPGVYTNIINLKQWILKYI